MSQNIKIFGVGLGRTGTGSLCQALRQLKFKTIHWPHSLSVIKRRKAGHCDLGELGQYDAILDCWPVLIYKHLDQEYPNTKFILTHRNEDKWLQSIEQHFLNNPCEPLETNARQCAKHYYRMSIFGSTFVDPEHYLQVYRNHNQNVQDYFSGRPEKLLVLNVCDESDSKKKWEALCGFLDRKVPNTPFPWRRDK